MTIYLYFLLEHLNLKLEYSMASTTGLIENCLCIMPILLSSLNKINNLIQRCNLYFTNLSQFKLLLIGVIFKEIITVYLSKYIYFTYWYSAGFLASRSYTFSLYISNTLLIILNNSIIEYIKTPRLSNI